MREKTPLIKIPFTLERPNPPFEAGEIRYPEALVRHFLKTYTKTGAKVFDPFAGLGTTLFVAEEMGRKPFGIEADRKRYEWVAGQLENWQNLHNADASKLASLHLPKMDFCITSPPYMPKHHKWNPLFAGNPKHAGYDKYLAQMTRIFKALASRMKRGATVVIQADNLRHGAHYTPLVRDLGIAAGASLTLQNEIIVEWQNPKPDYPYTHCLIFKNLT
ncbi:MAG: site-specific DNA-methyltransferase [Alphaproteobacteria bacterium]|nr:site-specific DNA-methyltransferase [Alphaproteobacteria bacterium]